MNRLSYITSDFQSFLIQTLLSLPVILIALTVHELCHGLVANACGDPTAKSMGRLSLNPLRHIDPIGFIMLIVVGFGFAKPVMVNPRNLRNPRRDMALVSASGPLSNLLLGFFSVLLLLIYTRFWNPGLYSEAAFTQTFGGVLYLFLLYGCYINIGLAIFNLIPIPPLDGSKILYSFLPQRALARIAPYEKYFQLVLFLLLFIGVFTKFLPAASEWVLTQFYRFWNAVFGLF